MGDRYTLGGLRCAYCNAVQEEVYYAESSDLIKHKCEKCGKTNSIVMGFHLCKITKTRHTN